MEVVMIKHRIVPFIAAGVAGASLLAGCGGGTKKVARAEVESKSATQLAASVGQATPKVTCPGDLTAKVGATLECVLVAQGDSTQLPVHIVVDSLDGDTAHFSAQVGQAAGGGDKAAFCADNAILNKATAAVTKAEDLPAILKANAATIDDFRTKAPPAIIDAAGTLAKAAKDAATSGDAKAFNDPAIEDAGKKVDAFCSVNSGGTPATSAAPAPAESTATTAESKPETQAAAGDKAAFCADNAILGKATSAATKVEDLPAILKDHASTLDDYAAKAPADISDSASVMVKAAKTAINSGDGSGFAAPEVSAAGPKVDAYCGQNSDGSPVAK
ncbi:MAG: hypothetical protein JWL70_185 [Acidimicrobiia bacterium]|nr:hypothetical protein [Acidimicrobiia bacterium]